MKNDGWEVCYKKFAGCFVADSNGVVDKVKDVVRKEDCNGEWFAGDPSNLQHRYTYRAPRAGCSDPAATNYIGSDTFLEFDDGTCQYCDTHKDCGGTQVCSFDSSEWTVSSDDSIWPVSRCMNRRDTWTKIPDMRCAAYFGSPNVHTFYQSGVSESACHQKCVDDAKCLQYSVGGEHCEICRARPTATERFDIPGTLQSKPSTVYRKPICKGFMKNVWVKGVACSLYAKEASKHEDCNNDSHQGSPVSDYCQECGLCQNYLPWSIGITFAGTSEHCSQGYNLNSEECKTLVSGGDARRFADGFCGVKGGGPLCMLQSVTLYGDRLG
jgi:hypothetical protein